MPRGAVLRRLDQLFDGGTVAGLGEGQLLERYLARRDEAAFEALVARHGPMVLGVCRRVLRDPDAVDDAFQAVFLVLVRKAGAIRHRDLLGPWLHAVATRTAHRARAVASRRRAVEGAAPTPGAEPPDPLGDPAARHDAAELRALLDEEVARLPEKYRVPVVLCYFQNHTHDEAAARLGWPVGTVRGRLARARDRLRDRLVRRGLAPAVAISSAVLVRQAAGASVPPALAFATLRAAVAAAGSGAMLTSVSVTAVALSREIARSLFMSKLKLAAAGAMTAAGLVTAGAAVHAVQEPRDVLPSPAASPSDSRPKSPDDAPRPIEEATVADRASTSEAPPAGDVRPAEAPSSPFRAQDAGDRPKDDVARGLIPVVPDGPPEASGADLAAYPRQPPAGPPGSQATPPMPPAPWGYRYERAQVVTGPDGATRQALVLVLDDQSSDLTPAPLARSANPVAPPSPNVQPARRAPEAMTLPSLDSERLEAPNATTDIKAYLARTRQEVAASIHTLSAERGTLHKRLQQIDADLESLHALQKALASEAPLDLRPISDGARESRRFPASDVEGGLFPPSADEALPDLKPLSQTNDSREGGLEFTAHRQDRPSPATADTTRIEALETRLAGLLETADAIRNEIQSLRHEGDELGPASFPTESALDEAPLDVLDAGAPESP
jgi:RNA polymerase sigma factor (sigma-70 family)